MHQLWIRVGTFLHCRPYLFFRCGAAFQPTDQRSPCRLGQRSENCCRFGRNPRCTDLWVRVGNGRPCVADPTFFFGAVWVPAEPTTVLGPLAQPTLRSLISWLKIPHRTEKKVRVGTEQLTVADPNMGSVQCALERSRLRNNCQV